MEERYLIICDDQQKSFFLQTQNNKDFKFVVSEAEFETFNTDEITNYSHIIIFAELQWQGKKYTDFCLNRNAARLLGYRPMKIRHGNGVSVVVRAGESPVHGEGKQLIILIQSTEYV